MAHFIYPSGTPLGTVPFGYVVPHTEWQLVIQQLFKAVNGDEGGTWAPSGFLTIGGAGLKLTGTAHQIAASARLTVASSGEVRLANGAVLRADGTSGDVLLKVTSNIAILEVESGAVAQIDAGGSLDISGSTTFFSGGSATWQSGATATFLSGGTLTLAGGSTLNANGAVAVRGVMTITNTAGGGPGSFIVGSDATFNMGSLFGRVVDGGALTWQSGSALIGASGATATWSAGWTFNGALTIGATGSIAGNASATSVWAGAWTFSGVLTNTGGVVQQSTLTFSGDDGYQVLRQNTGPDADATVDLWKQDVLVVPDITDNWVWQLAHPPSNRRVRCTIYWPVSSANHYLELQDGGTFLYVVDSSSGSQDLATLVLLYTGTRWVVESKVHKPRVFLGSGGDGDITLDAWRFDVIFVPPLTAPRTWSLTVPPVGTTVIPSITMRWPTVVSSFDLLVKTSGAGSEFMSLSGSTQPGGANAVIAYDGNGSWFSMGQYIH